MKRIFLGLMVVATAFGASAFTNNMNEGDIFVQATDDIYSAPTAPYSSLFCETPDDTPCAYVVTELGAANEVELQAPYTLEEIEEYTSVETPYLEPTGGNFIYEPSTK